VRRLVVLAWFLAPVVAAAGETAQGGSPARDVARLQLAARELAAQLDGLGPQDVWGVAYRLGALGAEAAPILASELEKAGEPKRLALGRALCMVGETGLGARALLELARAGSTGEVRALAARTLGSTPELLGLGPVAEALAELLEVETDGLARCALAEAALRVSSAGPGEPAAEARARAVNALKAMAELPGARESREAALVLGENGFHGMVRTRLAEMASEPTADGRRALMALRVARTAWAEVLGELMDRMEQAYVDQDEVDRGKLVDAAAKGMARSLDDFSDYLTEQEVHDMEEMISQSYEGIGAWVGLRDGFFTVISPVYGGPAARAGIRSLDRIVEVDGVSTDDLGFEKTVRRLKGPKGTRVELKVMRRGWSEAHAFSLTREEIKISNCYSAVLPGGVGYLKLVRFGERAGEEVRAAVAEILAGGAWSLVLDLRDNGGGLLSAAVEVSDIFLGPDKVIVYSQGRPEFSPLRRYTSSSPSKGGDGPDARAESVPLVVIVNSGSASASEIVAGSLQDWGRARVVGERTFGKGSVQSLIPVRATGGRTKLRLTIARYYLPTGRTIDRRGGKPGGVEPDVEVKEDTLSGWESEEIARLGLHERIDEHVRQLFERNRTLVSRAAEADGRSLDSYPGLREMVAALGGRVSDQAVRLLARASARRLVADDRGSAFVCDLQEDRVLRRAVYELLQAAPGAGLPRECVEILREFRPPDASPAASPAGLLPDPGGERTPAAGAPTP